MWFRPIAGKFVSYNGISEYTETTNKTSSQQQDKQIIPALRDKIHQARTGVRSISKTVSKKVKIVASTLLGAHQDREHKKAINVKYNEVVNASILSEVESNSLNPLNAANAEEIGGIIEDQSFKRFKIKKQEEWSDLMKASFAGNYENIENLLSGGTDVNQQDNNGNSPLLLASQNGHTDVIKLLLEKGAQMNIEDAILL